jgi:hypothetical protein
MGLTDALFAFAALCTGYIISDAITDAFDERAVARFTEQLNSSEGFPETWRMRPPAL